MTNVYLPNQIPLRIPYSPFKGFNFIKPIRISGTSSKLTDYQVKIELTRYNFPFEKCRSDGADLRFIDETNEVLNYWLESWSSSSKTATILCKIPEIPIRTDKFIWMLYGNPTASTTSNGDDTLIFFDNAETGTYSNKWVDIVGSGDYSTSEAYSGTKSVHQSAVNDGTIVSKDINTANAIFEAMVKNVGVNNQYTHLTSRASQSAKTYYSYRANYGGNAELYKRISGSFTSLDSDATTDSVTTWHKWSIKCFGSSIKTYFDDALRNETTNGDIASGGIGIRQVENNDMYLDNVIVRKYTSPEPTIEII